MPGLLPLSLEPEISLPRSLPTEPRLSPPIAVECAQVEVVHQHNDHDDGLYMLQYIEKVARHQPDFVQKKRRKRKDRDGNMLRYDCNWGDFPEMTFDPNDINELRFHMRRDIVNKGKEQKENEAAQAVHGQHGRGLGGSDLTRSEMEGG